MSSLGVTTTTLSGASGMLELYTYCAIGGGTLFLCQLLMMLFGFGGDHEADAGGDHDVGSHDGEGSHHGIDLHGLFTFRTLTVGVTLFGLTGRLVATHELSAALVALIAAGVGLAGLVGMGLLMRGLFKLEAEGTVRIQQALGEEAVVYLTIPGKRAGQGKITVKVQNRSMEYAAVTDDDAIPTGTPVEVVDLIDEQTLKVAPLRTVAISANDTAQQNATPVRKAEGGIHV